jgi:hypothetical protein
MEKRFNSSAQYAATSLRASFSWQSRARLSTTTCNLSFKHKTRKACLVLTIAVLPCVISSAEPETGSVCVAPAFEKSDPRSAPGLSCGAGKLSLQIDSKAMNWPINESSGVDRLALTTRHRVVVLCDAKPQQSFTFRFSDYKSAKLCLFLNDLYKTVQLKDVRSCPWCKCN